jgi:hypothetical protein
VSIICLKPGSSDVKFCNGLHADFVTQSVVEDKFVSALKFNIYFPDAFTANKFRAAIGAVYYFVRLICTALGQS